MGVMTEERWLTVTEVADHFRVDADTVRRWIKAGRLKGAQLGGPRTSFRIPRDEVDRLERLLRGER